MRIIAKFVGVLFIVAGLWGFADSGLAMDTTVLLGIFPVNALHNILHLVLGVWAYASSQAEDSAGRFCRFGGAIYLALGAGSFISDNPFELMPIGGGDRFLHLGVGLFLFLAGLADLARPRPRARAR